MGRKWRSQPEIGFGGAFCGFLPSGAPVLIGWFWVNQGTVTQHWFPAPLPSVASLTHFPGRGPLATHHSHRTPGLAL